MTELSLIDTLDREGMVREILVDAGMDQLVAIIELLLKSGFLLEIDGSACTLDGVLRQRAKMDREEVLVVHLGLDGVWLSAFLESGEEGDATLREVVAYPRGIAPENVHVVCLAMVAIAAVVGVARLTVGDLVTLATVSQGGQLVVDADSVQSHRLDFGLV
jgi:hypothetical protein